MKKNALFFILKIITVSAVFFLIYFLFYLRPLTAVPKVLISIEKEYTKDYFSLKENRVLLTAILQLKPSSPTFLNDKDKIISNLEDSNKNTLNELKDISSLEKIESDEDETAKFINDELIPKYGKLAERGVDVIKKESEIIDNLKTNKEILGVLYEYSVNKDFAGKDIVKEKEDVSERISRAEKGITEIQNKIKKVSTGDNNFEKEIQTSLALIKELKKNVQVGEKEEFKKNLELFDASVQKLKEDAFQIELYSFTTEKDVDLIKNETNLILEYEEILNKIKEVKVKKRVKL